MNKVITISREFGSGGRTIGKKVAEGTFSLASEKFNVSLKPSS